MREPVEPWRNPFEGWPAIPAEHLGTGRMAIVCDRHGKHVRTLYEVTREVMEGDTVARWTAIGTKWQAQRVGNFTWGAPHPEHVVHASLKPTREPSGDALARTSDLGDGHTYESRPLPSAESVIPVVCRCGSKALPRVEVLTLALEHFHRAGIESVTLSLLNGVLQRHPAPTPCDSLLSSGL